MHNEKTVHDPHYSEWVDGPTLITRTWSHTSSDIRPAERPYKWHSHYRGQLLCIETGLIHVRTEAGSWILPPGRAGWIPPGAMHSVHLCSALNGWSLLLTPEACCDLQTFPCVIGISDVLQALTLRSTTWSKLAPLEPEQTRIVAVILDEIKRSPHESLHLPIPKHEKLVKITDAILKEPGSMRSIEQWASIGSISARTLRRLIKNETGMSFGQWHQQAQLIHAMEMLARGVLVADVAFELGYASPSNFIAMFRRAFGDSPAHYFSTRMRYNLENKIKE